MTTSSDRTQETCLHAYIDNELAPSDRHELLQQILVDEELRERLCDLQRGKELVRQAFLEPPPPPRTQPSRTHFAALRRFGSVAAVLALMVLSFFGGLYLSKAQHPSLTATLSSMGAVGLKKTALETRPNRVLFHIASENHVKFTHTLDQATNLLTTYHKGDVIVEVVVNGGALNLLQAGDNPYAKRVHALMKEYPNLHIVACGIGIKYLESRGFPMDLMHQVRVAPSAVQEIVRRLRQGWVYINA